MKKLLFFSFCAGLLLQGCFNEDDCEDGSDCEWSPEPVEGELWVHVTINSENPAVPITIYEGDHPNGIVIYRDTLEEPSQAYIVPFDRYSVAATYKDGPLTITAVDGDRVKLKSWEDCGVTCYSVINGVADLKLKD